MAEFVEFRAEEWVPELQEMERTGLFESAEVKTIATKRKDLEYKIQRRNKCKSDFLKYIQFEIDLYRILAARRKKTGIQAKVVEIDHSQTQRIGNLFKLAIMKFPEDVQLWMSFFKFCKGVKFHSLVSRMLVRMLQNHSNKPELWAFAAKWECQQCKSFKNARQFLTKGLRHHPRSEMLYTELFTMELNYLKIKVLEIMKKMEEDGNCMLDEVIRSRMDGKLAKAVYDLATKVIPGLEFKVHLLNLAVQKKAPQSVYNKIYEDIVERHPGAELTWDTMAQRELLGFSSEPEKEAGEGTEGGEKKKPCLRGRIERSIAIYEEAVQKLNTPSMWRLYVDHALKLNKKKKYLPVYKGKVLKQAVEGAIACGKLSEDHYIDWISVLQQDRKKEKAVEEAFRRGTEHYPGSLPLWYARVRFYLAHEQEEKGIEVFHEAVNRLTDAVPVWKLVVNYLLMKSSPSAEGVIREGIGRGGDVAQTLKPFYVDWLAQTRGIEEARSAFESPEMNIPPCLELYQKMAALESGQTPPATERVRRCHELAAMNFGESEPSVWLAYIHFELSDGDKKRVTQLHRRALNSLSGEKVDEFVTEFNNYKMDLLRI